MDVKKECSQRLRELKEKYRYTEPDVFDTEDIMIRKVKWVIDNRLDTIDRTIILLYAESGSLRALASILGVSHSCIRPEVVRIKELVKDELEKIKKINNI